MTQTLISVRNVEEAKLALAAKTELIDIKEPRRGPLGAADPETVAEILAAVPCGVPVSIAGGELRDVAGQAWDHDNTWRSTERVLWSKVGLSYCDAWPSWRTAWAAWCEALPAPVSPVAVIYADRAPAHAPPGQEIMDAAGHNGCSGILVDTFDKSGGGLLDHLSLGDLATLGADAASRGLWLALAGSLDRTDLTRVLSLRPRYVAVRGAVCHSERTEALDSQKVAQWVAQVNSYKSKSLIDVESSIQ